ncbi:recombination protein NinB [Hyphomonas sp.]|uniref:recombination protein NinB n=1 Tax=Hyphomonas sp. TaxID=87 RepID=UPI00300112F3
MSTYRVTSEAQRQTALHDIRRAPLGFTLTAKRNKRSIPQNARMWAMLTIVAREVKWHGLTLSPEDWKLMFLEALGHEMRMVPNINGNGLVNLGRSSSALSKEQMTALMDLIDAFAAERGVTLNTKDEVG